MKKLIALALLLTMLLTLTFASAEQPASLQFREDGSFKIMILADTHVGYLDHHIGDTMKEYFNRVLADNQPDLIVLLGDNTNANNYDLATTSVYIDELMSFLDPLGIPVAMVFGNHEGDPNCPPKESQMAVYEKYDCFVGCVGVSSEKNVGNYNLPILSSDGSRTAFNLWFFDNSSGAVTGAPLNWYVETSNALNAANGGQPLPSMVFQHIAPSQVLSQLVEDATTKTGWALPEGVDGVLGEYPGAYYDASEQLNAIFAQGGVVAMVYGHDHANDYIIPYNGLDLVNVPGWSKLGDYNGMTIRGIGFIDLNENDLTTYGYYTVTPIDLGEMWFYGYALPGMIFTTAQ